MENTKNTFRENLFLECVAYHMVNNLQFQKKKSIFSCKYQINYLPNVMLIKTRFLFLKMIYLMVLY